MKFQVIISETAAADLFNLYHYISSQESSARANHVLERLQATCASLYTFPNRGSHPKEMILIGIKQYREIISQPYRIIYRVENDKVKVFVVMVVDGRRDMQALFHQRLLGKSD